jgi:adenylate cyclase
MAVEIERKFLVAGDAWKTGSGLPIRQGYLSRVPQRTVRIRVSGESASICVKGMSKGARRAEFEYAIPREDAEALLALCERPVIVKSRYRVQYAGRRWEIDEFHEENAGLVVAEIELERENDLVDLPPWVGAEVTDDPRYFNANLVANPYSRWAPG